MPRWWPTALGGLHHPEQSFRIEGANTGLAALVALSTLSLVP